MSLTIIVFGAVRSEGTVVVLLHKHSMFQIVGIMLSKHLGLSSILSVLPQIVRMPLRVSLTLQHMS